MKLVKYWAALWSPAQLIAVTNTSDKVGNWSLFICRLFIIESSIDWRLAICGCVILAAMLSDVSSAPVVISPAINQGPGVGATGQGCSDHLIITACPSPHIRLLIVDCVDTLMVRYVSSGDVRRTQAHQDDGVSWDFSWAEKGIVCLLELLLTAIKRGYNWKAFKSSSLRF